MIALLFAFPSPTTLTDNFLFIVFPLSNPKINAVFDISTSSPTPCTSVK